MVVALTVRAEGIPEIKKAMLRAPQLVLEELVREYKNDYNDWFGQMSLRFRGGVPLGGAFGPTLGLRRRTGALLGSFGRRIDENAASMVIFSTSPYSRQRERGGVILPRRGRYITIPLSDNLTGAGVPRFPSARALMGSGRTFIIKTKSGKAIIAMKRPDGGLEFLWVLKERVEQPGPETDGSRSRLGFFDEWADLEPDRQAGHRRALRRALGRVAGKGGA